MMNDKEFEEYKVQLRKVQLVQLEILKEIDRVCKKNDIPYHLDSGTLLGAVRHKGFIPWDDDLDIGMTRPNYERFLKVARSELDDRFYCLNWHDYDDYGLAFAKVKRKNTLYVENLARNSRHSEIYVDVFPYDNFPGTKCAKVLQGYPLLVLRALIKIKAGILPWAGGGLKKRLKYLPAVALAQVFSSSRMISWYEKIAQKYSDDKKSEWYFPQGISRYGTWILRKEWLDNLSSVSFENETFPAPSDSAAYLTHAYGDYMKLPPEEKRWNRHQILKVEFDENT